MIKRIIAIIVLTGVLVWLYPYVNKDISFPKREPAVRDHGTINFVQEGDLSFAPTGAQDKIYLSYKSSADAPTTTMELVLDEETVCVFSGSALPCMAMSSLYSKSFAGKRAVIEGVEKEARLTVWYIRIIDPEARVDR